MGCAESPTPAPPRVNGEGREAAHICGLTAYEASAVTPIPIGQETPVPPKPQ
jgi:hypothetical protein